AARLPVSPAQLALLQRRARRQTADQRRARRAALLRALAADPGVAATARRLRLNRLTVRLWRDRWLQAAPLLHQAEPERAPAPVLVARIEQLRGAAPRPGAPATFSPAQIVPLVAVACAPPALSGRPLAHGTARA